MRGCHGLALFDSGTRKCSYYLSRRCLEVVRSPSVEMLKTQLDTAPGNRLWLTLQGCLPWMTPLFLISLCLPGSQPLLNRDCLCMCIWHPAQWWDFQERFFKSATSSADMNKSGSCEFRETQKTVLERTSKGHLKPYSWPMAETNLPLSLLTNVCLTSSYKLPASP